MDTYAARLRPHHRRGGVRRRKSTSRASVPSRPKARGTRRKTETPRGRALATEGEGRKEGDTSCPSAPSPRLTRDAWMDTYADEEVRAGSASGDTAP